MDGNANSVKNLKLAKVLLVGFVISILISLYFFFIMPSEIRIRGNVQNMEPINPFLIEFYITIGVTLLLGIGSIYFEIRNKSIVIVFKDKTISNTKESLTEDIGSKSVGSLDVNKVNATDLAGVLSESLNILSQKLDAVAGACYESKNENGSKWVELISGFALPTTDSDVVKFNYGEGLVGQVAKSGKAIYVDEIPDGYIQAVSGLGSASPRFILIMPLKKNDNVVGVFEVATFKNISAEEKEVAEKFISGLTAKFT